MKITSILLVFAMLLCCFAGCSDQTTDKETGDTGNDTESIPLAEQTDLENYLDIPKDKLNTDFVILSPIVQGFNYSLSDWDEPSEDAYENAYYLRNSAVEEMLGVNISSVEDNLGNDVYNKFKLSVDANTDEYDICFNNLPSSCTAVGAGYCLPLDSLEYVNLDKAWWSDSCTEQMAIGGKNYMAAGDISISDKECLWAIYFIKDYINQYGLENPYDLVMENKWTWDKMTEMYNIVSNDVDGNGVMDQSNDIWGLTTHRENYAACWQSAGLKLVELDENGAPYLNWNNENFYQVYEKIRSIMEDTEHVSTDIYFMGKSMREATTLFATDVIGIVRSYRTHEYDFGILPYPKYNSDVDEYYTYVAVSSCVLTVGKQCSDTYSTSIIIEAMAAKGKEIITPIYYEGQLQSRTSRDAESSAMLDIIFEHRSYDLGVFFDWGYMDISVAGANPAVIFAENERVFQKKIERTFENLDIY